MAAGVRNITDSQESLTRQSHNPPSSLIVNKDERLKLVKAKLTKH